MTLEWRDNQRIRTAIVPLLVALALAPACAAVTSTPSEALRLAGVQGELIVHLGSGEATVRNLLEAYSRCGGETWTDESSLLRAAGFAPALVAGARDNLKVTSPGDERLAAALFLARADADR